MSNGRVARLDERVIVAATMFAHWFQRWTGRTSFFLAKCGMTLAGLSALVRVVDYWWPILTVRTDVFTLVMFLFMVVSAAHRAGRLDDADSSVRDGRLVLPTSILILRSVSPYARVFWLLLTIPIAPVLIVDVRSSHWLAQTVADAMLPGCCIAEYFVMVDPLPPGTSKVREFVSSLLPGPAPHPVNR